MPLQSKVADYHPKGINRYVPAMAYAADVVHTGPTRISLGTPTIADPDGIMAAAIADNTAASFTYRPGNFRTVSGFDGSVGEITNAKYGRNVSIVGSAAGVTQSCTVKGRDYLGQPIVRTVALNGTTTVAFGVFKWVDEITLAQGPAAGTVNVGFTDVLGLPYKCVKVIAEELASAVQGTLGALVSPSLVDPRTSGTVTSPRGTYDPNGTLDGVSEVTITCVFSNSVNAAGNGGLHGIREFGG